MRRLALGGRSLRERMLRSAARLDDERAEGVTVGAPRAGGGASADGSPSTDAHLV